MSVNIATSRGTCASCRTKYEVGTPIIVKNGRVTHASCKTATMNMDRAMRMTLRTRPRGHRF